ncbi:hypothetical protein [Lactobacillus crispatus]|uniref:hypothetical protein n=1 Tax=Lactobacillus crispatus TaxID=47770 RepID=UPI000B5D95A4|nr:hypothetical protein [Lactobacillus crispatus]OXC13294.1 hypothetical protein AYP78_09260 [Lactobacillus crispatus]OXC17671.1 hypothetical protein AYP79_07180 [Lactobacillus crispatus]OXC19076.1 hypothetical protein AYP80_08595 [Lactobacillus crispatus]
MKENKKEILPATSARSKTEETRKQLEAMESVVSLQDQHIVEAEAIKLKSEYLPINEDKLIEILNREIRYAIDAGKSKVVIGQDFFRLHSKEVNFAYSCGSMTDQLALRLRQEKEMSLEQRSHRHAEYIEREVIKQITSKGLPYASRFYFDSHKRFWLKGIVNLGWGQLTNIYRLIEASRRLLDASGYNTTIKPFSGHKALIVRW